MSLKLTEARAAGFGARRFLVDRHVRLSEADHALLRTRYNDYPERFAQVGGFPAPGRRGPSRPKAQADQVLPEPITYPIPRPRDLGEDINLGGFVGTSEPGGAGGAGGSLAECVIEGGSSLGGFFSVAAGATSIFATNRIPRPYIVTAISFHNNGATQADLQIQIKIAEDTDLAGGMDTTGIPIGEDLANNPFLRSASLVFTVYPNTKVNRVNTAIKFCHQNNSGLLVAFHTYVSIQYM